MDFLWFYSAKFLKILFVKLSVLSFMQQNSNKISFTCCKYTIAPFGWNLGAWLKLSSILIPHFSPLKFQKDSLKFQSERDFMQQRIQLNERPASDVSFAMLHICISHDAWNKIFILFIKLFYWQLERLRQSHPSIFIQMFSHQIFISKVSRKSFLSYACLLKIFPEFHFTSISLSSVWRA